MARSVTEPISGNQMAQAQEPDMQADNISGFWHNNQWFSDQHISGAPRRWSFEPLLPAYHICYITIKELDILKNKYANLSVLEGPSKIGYIGDRTASNLIFSLEKVANAPLFWRSDPQHDLALLIYLTDEQAKVLIDLDIYNSDIAANPHYGPDHIISYQGGGDGSGDGGSAGSCGVGSSTGCVAATADGPSGDSGFVYGGDFDAGPLKTRANSGVYAGSLSAQGNMVAFQMNNSGLREVPKTDDLGAEPKIGTEYQPYIWGYFRQYWQDPKQTIFGANTAIPALTGVMPEKFSQLTLPLQGDLIYYIDLAICRFMGFTSNGPAFPDQFYMINAFNQMLGWTLVSNDYINSVNNAESRDLTYYGSNNYTDYITKGFEVLLEGQSVLRILKNIGLIIQTVPSGYFGTANSIAKIIIDNGLGFVGGLSTNLIAQGIDLEDIYNPIYTRQIANELGKITEASDLILLQTVLETKIKNFSSPLDYLNIAKVAGGNNDSKFTSMANLGITLYNLAPALTFRTGEILASTLERLRKDGATGLANIKGSGSSLNSDITNSMRSFLPQTADNQTISILNVIGTASGYLLSYLKKVNDGLAALYATSYGPRIREAFELINRAYAEIALTQAEITAASNNANYWVQLQELRKNQYYALINEIIADRSDNISFLVNLINTNYDILCQQIYFEINNFNKANPTIDSFGDNTQLFNFVQSMPYYGADPNSIGTDALLYGCAANNQGGDLVRAILASAKNNQLLGEAGISFREI